MINKETLNNFFKYLDYIDSDYEKLIVKKNSTKEEQILTNLACLTEEVGEVATEVRKMTKMSFNQKKVDSFKMQDLEDEIVDVLITNLLLAKSC
jgi:NTP pyrophosphatase (non-canonical NTP hydrolase)